MAICDPCAEAADYHAADRHLLTATKHPLAAIVDYGHDPAICRDHGRTPNGCGCQHRPAGSALPEGTARA